MRSTTRPASQEDITSIRLPGDEKQRVERLAAEVGTSRSKLLRAAFAAIEAEDHDVIRARLAKLPPDRRSTPWPRTRYRVPAAPAAEEVPAA